MNVGQASLEIASVMYKTDDFDSAEKLIKRALTVCQQEAQKDVDMILKRITGPKNNGLGT